MTTVKNDGWSGRTAAQAANSRRRTHRRKSKKTLHYILIVLFVLAAGAALSLTVFFKVEAVTVLGSSHYPPDDIAASSGIVKEENLLRIDKQAVAEQILAKYPYIEAVQVHRKLSRVVEIQVTQCEPAGAIAQDGEYLLITREGKVLERGVFIIPDNVPLIKGVQAGGLQPGEYLGSWEKEPRAPDETPEQAKASEERDAKKQAEATAQQEALVTLGYLTQAMDQTGFHAITNVDFTDKLNLKIVYEARIILELGTEADLPYKLTFVKELLDTKIGPHEQGVLYAADVQKKMVRFKPKDIGRQTPAENADNPSAEQGTSAKEAGEDGTKDTNT